MSAKTKSNAKMVQATETSFSASRAAGDRTPDSLTDGLLGAHYTGDLPSRDYDPYARDAMHDSKYWRSLQTLKPIRFTNRKVPAPIDNAGLLSFITFSWLTPTVMKAKRCLSLDDIPLLSKYDSANHCAERLRRLYREDAERHPGDVPKIGRALFRFIRTRLIASSFVISLSMFAAFCGPAFLVSRLVNFSTLSDPSLGYGIALTCGLVVTEMTRSLAFATYWGVSNRTAIRARAAVISMVFHKIGNLRSLKDKSVGELVNLLSNDGTRLAESIMFGGIIVGAPVIIIATTIFSCLFLGWTALLGILTFLVFVPIQMGTGKYLATCRRRCIKITDKRVRMMNEILNSVKLIKMYAWESSFANTTAKIRKNEEEILRKAGTIQSMQISLIQLVPIISSVVTFVVHTLLGYELDATKAFTIIGVFNAMRFLIAILPQSVKALAEVFISFKRIDDLLLMEEIDEYYGKPVDKNIALELNNLTAAWDVTDTTGMDAEKNVEVLFDLNLIVPKGRLIGVCGAVGSGKSSLMAAMLGQLRLQKGRIDMQGDLAYVPQQAWIFHDSVRENILFGSSYDKEKFDAATNACSLTSDFKILPDGEQTEVGDRGINLSGGQKQRISLARALYSGRDIILLDDPLSAVDAHVGKHIFFECIKKAMRGRTVIFVTHQLQYLKDCDEVIVMQEGRFAEHGHHDQLMADSNDYADMIENFYLEQKKEEESDNIVDEDLIKTVLQKREKTRSESEGNPSNGVQSHAKSNGVDFTVSNSSGDSQSEDMMDETIFGGETKQAKKEPTKLIQTETKQKGSIKLKTYVTYMKAAGGIIVSMCGMLLFALLMFGITMNNWWLTAWVNAGGAIIISCPETSTVSDAADSSTLAPVSSSASVTNSCVEIRDPNITTNENIGFYQLIYFLIMLGTVVLSLMKALVYIRLTLGASTSLHNQVFTAVFRSPMSFFDTTPSGRILNRFSRDLDDIDIRLVLIMDMFIQQIFNVLLAVVTVVVVFYWFAVVIAVLAVAFGFIYVAFKSAVREFKRIDNVTRSPWFSHVSSTVQGLSTIHAYDKTNAVISKFGNLLDTNTSPYFCYLNTMRWLSVRLDALTITVTASTCLFVVFSTIYPEALGDTSASFAGLALTYSIQMTGLFQVCVRFSVETESYFTSVERINEYILHCPSEIDQETKLKKPHESWPEQGAVRFHNASMRYRDDLPLVLKNVYLRIQPKEKVGIVGRTGSGKSSLGVTLFRLTDLCRGKILIDDLDISQLALSDVRPKLSIIPQEPVLFVGTVRYNLDPFQQYSDAQIWKALERSHVKDVIANLDEKLDAEVVENGENFSVGERQLMCMARAILRGSRVIMLDEATAAIDSRTDSLVQETIRDAFADCTMLTIAHRLNTVLTCDKILVMDDGRVAEFDEPGALLSNPESHFSKMIAAAASVNKRDGGGDDETRSEPSNDDRIGDDRSAGDRFLGNIKGVNMSFVPDDDDDDDDTPGSVRL